MRRVLVGLKRSLDHAAVKIGDLWAGHPTLDIASAAIIVCFHLFLVWKFAALKMLPWSDSPQRLAVYAAGAGMMALIAGFAGTAIALYGSATGPAMQQLRESHGRTIRKNWKSILGWLLISAVLCLFSMVVESKESTNFSEWSFEFAILMSIWKFCRLIFVFHLVMRSVDISAQKQSEGDPLTWTPKADVAEFNARKANR